MSNTPAAPMPLEILRRYFGYDAFRPGQQELIGAALAGRDVLGIMPTGAGKSLCYQVPALMLPGFALVVSPLISLMQDQVSALIEAGVSAAFLNSSLPYPIYQDTVQRALAGIYKILYVAPERLLKDDILSIVGIEGDSSRREFAVTNIADNGGSVTPPLSMLVIDEAHCVSQWGHDFRPSYLTIRDFIMRLPRKPVIAAFTATATANVRKDIAALLNLDSPLSLVTGFDRPNLYFEVQRLSGTREKTAALLQYLHSNPGKNGIVYCATRKTVEEVCDALCGNGYGATRYHAGLDDEERHANQEDFIYDRKSVMVATNAFGMGIDKSNVSFVIHYNMPKNIEGYYQEAGRAGRDGEAADCILYYNGQDVRTNQFLIEHNEGVDAIKAHNLDLLKYMTFYSTSSDCLRSTILRYFGETAPIYCGHCSNCLTHFESLDISLAAKKIVSCVYRVEQRGAEQGVSRHFGKTMIADILHGSKNAKVMEAGFDTLSTYGLMADTPTARIRTILDYLIETGYLALDGNDYPVVARTEKSSAVLSNGFVLEMKLPKIEEVITARATVHEQEDASIDQGLLARLKKLRASLARDAHVPAYIVFSDATLRDMCILKPRTRDDFLLVAGVGRRKLERYGADFLAEINRN